MCTIVVPGVQFLTSLTFVFFTVAGICGLIWPLPNNLFVIWVSRTLFTLRPILLHLIEKLHILYDMNSFDTFISKNHYQLRRDLYVNRQ